MVTRSVSSRFGLRYLPLNPNSQLRRNTGRRYDRAKRYLKGEARPELVGDPGFDIALHA